MAGNCEGIKKGEEMAKVIIRTDKVEGFLIALERLHKKLIVASYLKSRPLSHLKTLKKCS